MLERNCKTVTAKALRKTNSALRMGDLDDIGFPVETAKPKIFQVRVNHVRPHSEPPLPTMQRSRAVP